MNSSFNFVPRKLMWLLHKKFHMLVILLFLFIGVSLGLSLGKISILLKMNEKMLTLAIYSLLFMIAISLGIDDLILRSLDSIGWFAFILIVGAVAASTAICRHLYNAFFKKYKSKSLVFLRIRR